MSTFNFSCAHAGVLTDNFRAISVPGVSQSTLALTISRLVLLILDDLTKSYEVVSGLLGLVAERAILRRSPGTDELMLRASDMSLELTTEQQIAMVQQGKHRESMRNFLGEFTFCSKSPLKSCLS